ncbi:hypothetical protein M3193_02530 [Sporosarcina luteola]|uniref:hypothetical protein n=1 Tax=Sporosarcina luteola TaxID=582850 RepID=UPI00203C23BA|nr:hypothetical protein [Sporosarcina luteola]MCM3743010.1 hypothetical protein [Sporosarcina luteola]
MKMVPKTSVLLPSVIAIVLLLSGCMYKGEDKAVRENPYEDQLELIQKAVNAYKENNGGLLPIKTRDQETDMYIKYPIEFSKIVPAYTEKIPSNAYETGGIYQYVLMDVEENPTVKLVDLRIAERIRDLNLRKHINGKLPFKDPVGENVYEIDYEAMGFKEPLKVESPYSDALLPIVVGGDGHFYVDYSIDLNRILQEEKPDVKKGEDIRYLLSESYPILPAYSLPYTVNDKNEPVFLKK